MYFEILPTTLIIAAVGAVGFAGYRFLVHRKTVLDGLDEPDRNALYYAINRLERPSLAARLAGMVGGPIALIGQSLPPDTSQAIAAATSKSLEAAFKVALLTLSNERQKSSQLLHRALVVASGAAGGALGIASLTVELPVSTIIMLRSILDIARSEGEKLNDPEAVLSCVAVLGLGARVDGGYFALREKLAGSATEAALYIAERGAIEEASSIVARLLAQVATPFGFVVSEKAAAQMVPVVGALGGAVINYAFIGHFQAVARGHFIVRRLERKYGKPAVFAAYEQARADLKDED
jgi:hypothetical protein